MPTRKQRAFAFARQAQFDLATGTVLAVAEGVPECHGLHFLQMACEKLCKAYLYDIGSADAGDLEKSHCYVAKHLPEILKDQYERTHGKKRGRRAERMVEFRALAREIQMLSPACDDGGRRLDNCEYPWVAGDSVIVPAEHGFPGLYLLDQPSGAELLKLVSLALARIVQDSKDLD